MFQNFSTVMRGIQNSTEKESIYTIEDLSSIPSFYIEAHYDFDKSLWFSSLVSEDHGPGHLEPSAPETSIKSIPDTIWNQIKFEVYTRFYVARFPGSRFAKYELSYSKW